MDQLFLLPKSLGDAIINYLAEQPFKQVAHLVQGLQQLQPVPNMQAPSNAVPLPEVQVSQEV